MFWLFLNIIHCSVHCRLLVFPQKHYKSKLEYLSYLTVCPEAGEVRTVITEHFVNRKFIVTFIITLVYTFIHEWVTVVLTVEVVCKMQQSLWLGNQQYRFKRLQISILILA